MGWWGGVVGGVVGLGWIWLDQVGLRRTGFDRPTSKALPRAGQNAVWNDGMAGVPHCRGLQGWFYPLTRQRCVFLGTYKSSTR